MAETRNPKSDTFVFSCAKTRKSDRTPPPVSMAQDYTRSIDERSYVRTCADHGSGEADVIGLQVADACGWQMRVHYEIHGAGVHILAEDRSHMGSRTEASKHSLRRHLGVSRRMPGENSEDM